MDRAQHRPPYTKESSLSFLITCISKSRVKSIYVEDVPEGSPVEATDHDSQVAVHVSTLPVDANKPSDGPEQCTSLPNSFVPLASQEIKILIVGDRFTGKTALLQTLITGKFSWNYDSTNYLGFKCKAVNLRDTLYTLHFWDRSGDGASFDSRDDEEFYRDANAALVVYDLTKLKQTLPNAVEYKKKIDNFVCLQSGKSIPMLLLGNKCDVENCSFNDGTPFAESHGFIGHFRTSAVIRVGIDSAMEVLVREVHRSRANS